MPKARLKLPQELESLLASDWERVLEEATLGTEDTMIARLYILKQMPQIDIAVELNMDRSTVSRRVDRIITRACRVAKKLGI